MYIWAAIGCNRGADGYHVASVHWNYAATTNQRKAAAEVAATKDAIRAMDAGG
jgi:benzoate/toluate 1,2-dioxygenase alpha subunit